MKIAVASEQPKCFRNNLQTHVAFGPGCTRFINFVAAAKVAAPAARPLHCEVRTLHAASWAADVSACRTIRSSFSEGTSAPPRACKASPNAPRRDGAAAAARALSSAVTIEFFKMVGSSGNCSSINSIAAAAADRNAEAAPAAGSFRFPAPRKSGVLHWWTCTSPQTRSTAFGTAASVTFIPYPHSWSRSPARRLAAICTAFLRCSNLFRTHISKAIGMLKPHRTNV